MNRTQIIKKVVGEKLKDYGFRFLKTDDQCRIFVREAHGFKRNYDPDVDMVKQYILIQQHRFGNLVAVHFKTDASNRLVGEELAVLRELNPEGGAWFAYSNDDEYEEVLTRITEIIINHGLDFLQQMSIDEEIIPTKAMADQLYENHRELDKSFISKYKMDPVPHSSADIEEWFQTLKRILISVSEKPYEEVKELLVEMAAFIGERNCELLGSKWFFEEGLKTPRTQGENHQGFGFVPLKSVVIYYGDYKEDKETARPELWFYNEIEELQRAFLENN